MSIDITDATFDEKVLKSTLPVLVKFWAPWCGPCRALAPVIEELAEEFAGKVSIVKMNVDENPVTPGQFNIRAIPTIILFKDGQVVDQVTGAVSKANLKDLLAKKALA